MNEILFKKKKISYIVDVIPVSCHNLIRLMTANLLLFV